MLPCCIIAIHMRVFQFDLQEQKDDIAKRNFGKSYDELESNQKVCMMERD